MLRLSTSTYFMIASLGFSRKRISPAKRLPVLRTWLPAFTMPLFSSQSRGSATLFRCRAISRRRLRTAQDVASFSHFRSAELMPSSSTKTLAPMKTLPTTRWWLRRLRGAALDRTQPRMLLRGTPAGDGGLARFRSQASVILGLGNDYRQHEFGGSTFRLGSCSLSTSSSEDAAFQTIRSNGSSLHRAVQAFGNWSWPGSIRTQTGERTIKRDRFQDEGDWRYSPEWWGTQGGGWGRSKGDTVFETASMMGNGVVSVTAHPASRPVGSKPSLERSHQAYGRQKQREEDLNSSQRKNHKEAADGAEGLCDNSSYKLLGYEWRVLRFNDVTRQSVAKVKALSTRSADVVLLQQPDCIAFEYLKSMISAGMAAVSLCGLDFEKVQQNRQSMRVLCVGMGGGSVPLFLADRLPGASVDVVDIDGAVIAAAVDSMGFPPTRAPAPSNGGGAATEVEALLWGNVLEQITVYENDGESFVHDQLRKAAMEVEPRKYDLVVVDAFDGKDVIPWSLCNRNGSFLRDLSSLLSDEHGAVVVNLHTDSAPPSLFERISGKFGPGFDPTLPQGRRVQDAALAYRDVLLQKPSGSWPRTVGKGDALMEGNGLAFTVAVAYQANITLVVCRGALLRGGDIDGFSELATEDSITENLMSEAEKVQHSLRIPFEMSKRVSRGFRIVR